MTIRISGTGSALPQRKVTNRELTELVETSDQWIRERTGIEERRISVGETVADLAADACRQALQMAERTAREVELILVATCTPELLLPCCGCQVQSMIGASQAAAFDLNAACSGFLFALDTAYAYMKAGIYKNALVVGSEVISKLVDWSDRSTCVLFGDGAGAVFAEAVEEEIVCENGRKAGVEALLQGADGGKGGALSCQERPVKNPFLQEAPEACAGTADPYVHMDGREVYKFATRQVPACIQAALGQAGLEVGDVDLFLLHQANERIIAAAAKRLKADLAKFPMNLQRVGNMSSATIPVLLDELVREERIQRGDRLVLSGFGAGLTYGATVLVWG